MSTARIAPAASADSERREVGAVSRSRGMGVGWAQLFPAAVRERDSPPAALRREQEAGEEGENGGLAGKEGGREILEG